MKTMRGISGLIGALVGLAFFAVAGTANAAILYTSSGGSPDPNIRATMGMEFTPSVDILVTDLGVFDGGSDGAGLETDRAVGLWTSGGSLLASVTVTGADPLMSGFRFAAIIPVALAADATYIVGAHYPHALSGDKLFGTSPTADPLIALGNTTRFVFGSTLTFPTETNDFFRTTANLLFTQQQIPEPATLTLFVIALGGLGFMVRRRLT